jgi:site-specific recombinase XerD
VHATVVQREVRQAVMALVIPKPATWRMLQHRSRLALLEDGSGLRTVQDLLGHRDVATTMIYTQVLSRRPPGVRSPADRLLGG